jgi:hypothetical protein
MKSFVENNKKLSFTIGIVTLIVIISELPIAPIRSFFCTYREVTLPIPEKFVNATIKFEKPVYYWMGAQNTCRMDLSGSIWLMDSYWVNSTSEPISPVATSTTFKIVGNTYVSCKIPLLCMDSGDPGKAVILQGSDGKKWIWEGVKGSYPNSIESEYLDGVYYVDGQRVDFVRSADFPNQ